MRILMVHNFYQRQGGEDVVFAAEIQMLRAHGHDVFEFTAHNANLKTMNVPQMALNTIWSHNMKTALASKIRDVQPDVVHFHNIFLSISPSAYYACKQAGIPVVQTLHNYRLLCPKATLHRDNAPCMDCVRNATLLPALKHACYRDSRLHTLGVASMLHFHRLIRTWSKQVDRYICLTEAGRQLFIEGGMNENQLVVKGNFLQNDPGVSTENAQYFVYVGRLTEEKGVRTLVDAWALLPHTKLKIVGDGDLRQELEAIVEQKALTNITFMGHLPREAAIDVVKKSMAQIVPSEWEEPFGLVAIEAFACGKPVIASKIGALVDIVDHGITGLHFTPGSPYSLAEQVEALMAVDYNTYSRMAEVARKEFETQHTSEVNYERLFAIYNEVVVHTDI